MVITTKIKELQYYNKFNEVFVLSLLILATNIIGKFAFTKLAGVTEGGAAGQFFKLHIRKTRREVYEKDMVKKSIGDVYGCPSDSDRSVHFRVFRQKQDEQVVIYSNADDEAVEAMKKHWTETDTKGNIFFRRLEPQNWEES